MGTQVLPLGCRLLVRPDQPPHESHGLALPESAIRRPESGEVVAVSIELVDEFPVGTRVAFAPYSGIELTVDGQPRIVLGRSEILGVYVATAG